MGEVLVNKKKVWKNKFILLPCKLITLKISEPQTITTPINREPEVEEAAGSKSKLPPSRFPLAARLLSFTIPCDYKNPK